MGVTFIHYISQDITLPICWKLTKGLRSVLKAPIKITKQHFDLSQISVRPCQTMKNSSKSFARTVEVSSFLSPFLKVMVIRGNFACSIMLKLLALNHFDVAQTFYAAGLHFLKCADHNNYWGFFDYKRAELTRVWINREIRLPLQYAVDQFSTVPIHWIISICGCYRGNRGTCGAEEQS